MKKTIALCLGLALSLMVTASASQSPWEAENEAWQLYNMGLFLGTGVDDDGNPTFALDRQATRAEGVTMLVRLLGAEEEALAGNWTTPFTDVPDWAKPYVGYAYENGLTVGTSATAFSPGRTITGTQYATFVLRAMGYDSDTDFPWDDAWDFLVEVGALEEGMYSNEVAFDRGDAVIVSYLALNNGERKEGGTLLEELKEQGAVDLTASRCDWDVESFANGSGSFLFGFAPVKDSEEAYVRFTVEKATVNGVDCEIIPIDTAEKVEQHVMDMTEKYGEYVTFADGTFGVVYLYYDRDAVLAAAGEGELCLTYRIWAAGELKDGTTVREFAAIGYYVTDRGEV